MEGISPKYYSISHYSMEKGMVNHNNSICIYIGLNRSNYIASGTQFIKWSMCGSKANNELQI